LERSLITKENILTIHRIGRPLLAVIEKAASLLLN